MPVPFLVSVPVPVPIMLLKLLPVLVPSSVSAKVEPAMVPTLVSKIFPLLALMVLAAPSVINPL